MHRQLKVGWICGSTAALVAFVFGPLPGAAAENAFPPLLFAAEGAKKIIEYGRDGKVAWEYPAEMSRDVWHLANGNVLFCFNRDYDSQRNDRSGGVMEVSPDMRDCGDPCPRGASIASDRR